MRADLAEALGYRPSPIARALVSGQTRLLALLVSDIPNPFYPQLAKSVEQEAKRDGYTVVICNTADNPAETRRYSERLLGQGLDGVIHASVVRDEDALLTLIADPRRVVFTNRRSIPTIHAVNDPVALGALECAHQQRAASARRCGARGLRWR